MRIDAVIDNSAMIELFTGTRPDPSLRRHVLRQPIGAPELIDIEAVIEGSSHGLGSYATR